MNDNDDAHAVEYAAFDPVDAFEQTISDLIQVVEMFQTPNSPMSPMEFLQAAAAAEERLEAITTVMMHGITGAVQGKIPPEVRAEFQSKKDLDELMTSPEEKQQRMIKSLRGIASFQRLRPPNA